MMGITWDMSCLESEDYQVDLMLVATNTKASSKLVEINAPACVNIHST
jgi:hypothetical protein